jgi:hypothetical protein
MLKTSLIEEKSHDHTNCLYILYSISCYEFAHDIHLAADYFVWNISFKKAEKYKEIM